MKRVAAALAVAVVAVAGVALAAGGHRHVRPSVRVESARVVAGALRFALDVSFHAPTGVRGASPCSGRVVARARHHRWSGGLHRAAAGCHALVAGHMRSAMAGHRVSFRVSFRGNRRVAAFSVTRRLLLAAGAPVRPMLTPPPGF